MKSLALALLLASGAGAFAQGWLPSPLAKWAYRYDGGQYEIAYLVAVAPNGDVLTAGKSEGYGRGQDWLLTRTDKDGKRLWERAYSWTNAVPDGTPNKGYEQPYDLAVDRRGNAILVGESDEDGTLGVAKVVRVGPTGDLLSVQNRDNVGGFRFNADLSVKVLPDDSFYVAGMGYQGSRSWAFLTKYSASGNFAFRHLVAAQAYNGFRAVDVDASGNVYATGFTQDASNEYDVLTVSYSPGAIQRWVRQYSSPHAPGSSYDDGQRLAVAPDGTATVGAYSAQPGTGGDFLALRYDRDGNLLWDRRLNGSASLGETLTNVVLDPEGNAYVSGQVANGTPGSPRYQIGIVRYGALGQILSTSFVDGTSAYRHRVFPRADGGFRLAYPGWAGGYSAAAVSTFSPVGALTATDSFRSFGRDASWIEDAALDSDGGIVAAGIATNAAYGASADALTMRFKPRSEPPRLLWVGSGTTVFDSRGLFTEGDLPASATPYASSFPTRGVLTTFTNSMATTWSYRATTLSATEPSDSFDVLGYRFDAGFFETGLRPLVVSLDASAPEVLGEATVAPVLPPLNPAAWRHALLIKGTALDTKSGVDRASGRYESPWGDGTFGIGPDGAYTIRLNVPYESPPVGSAIKKTIMVKIKDKVGNERSQPFIYTFSRTSIRATTVASGVRG